MWTRPRRSLLRRPIPWDAGAFRLVIVLLGLSCGGGPDPTPAGQNVAARTDGMVLVPAGRVVMGTDSADIPRLMQRFGLSRPDPLLMEVPPRTVEVAAFYLDTVAVTNRAFAAFVAARPEWSRDGIPEEYHNGRYLEHWTDGRPDADVLDHPVTFVTWWAGVAFCDWRDKRLPTEAEWEWAARGGDPDAVFPWGTALPDSTRANWGANGIDATMPVGSYPPNAYGLYDLAGNVWEFLVDPWYGSYGETPLTQPVFSPDTLDRVRTRRVVRGGSWGANVVNLRIRYRDSHRPFDAADIVGFRCARSVGSPEGRR